MDDRVIICGAGIAGISTAYFLTVRHGIRDVVLVDERPPLSLTSDKSTEAYRNFWPGPDDSMVALINRSIDLMEEMARATDNRFLLNRRGYVYATARADTAEHLMAAAEQAAALGAGPLRVHTSARTYTPSPSEGFEDVPPGVDVLLGRDVVRTHFPYLNPETRLVVHARRAGWLSAQQLGMYLLEQARAHGARLLQGKVIGVETRGGRVGGVRLRRGGREERLDANVFVNAAGPFAGEVARLLGVDLPIYCERHTKLMFNDHLGVVPRQAPMLIWADPQRLPWAEEEREMMADDPALAWLLEEMPPGAHLRPEGGGTSTILLLLWAYETRPVEPTLPVEFDPLFADVVLRGMAALVPALRRYWERAPRPVLDGGYYTKTRENLPLIGPLPVPGSYIIAALSGFGIMAACAAGELLAAHITGHPLPPYAAAFHPARYTDASLYPALSAWSSAWQL